MSNLRPSMTDCQESHQRHMIALIHIDSARLKSGSCNGIVRPLKVPDTARFVIRGTRLASLICFLM